MKNALFNYVSKYVDISDELKEVILESANIREYKKGEMLLEADSPCREGFLILKGCVRRYIVKDGEEKTVDFYDESMPIVQLKYDKEAPSGLYLQCLEDTVVNLSTQEHEAEMFIKYPKFDTVCRIISDVLMVKMQQNLNEFKLMTAEERYLDFIKNRPTLLQKVPQYQIASYLGITPESLSRLRKRLSKRK